MSERDLIREARAALDDLIDLTPKAPSLKSITAGYATLRHVEPPLTRWRPVAILLAAAAITLFVVGIASLVGSNVVDGETDGVSAPQTAVSTVTTPTSKMPVEGIWVLTTYVIDGTTKTMNQAALAARGEPPTWIGITPEGVVGYTGCNGFNSDGTTPTFDGERLVFEQIVVQARGCLGETPESAMQAVLRAAPEGAAVSFGDDGDTMTLTAGTVVLTFERRDRQFVERVAVWPTSTGRLDCSADAYLVRTLPDSSRSIDEVLKGVPGVTTIEPGDPVSWGLDGSGVVVAGAAIADVEPREIRIVACSETYGVRPGVDLAEATRIWVNDLGLAQTSPLVWGDRFVELCSFDSPDLGTLAELYVSEDAVTSIRGDGSTPTPQEAAMTLEMIQRGTCATDRSPTTTVPAQTQDEVSTTTTTPLGTTSCSTTGMEIPPDYPPAYEGLPDPVARTWGMLYDAALGCDFEGILTIALENAESGYSDAIFWGATGTLEGLVRYDADYGSLRSLVLALTTLPVAPFEGQRYDAETQTTVPQDYWSWPPVHDDLGDGASITDLWDTDTLERVAALNDMTVPELVASIDEFGGYAGFRVGIAEDGSWLFALAGD